MHIYVHIHTCIYIYLHTYYIYIQATSRNALYFELHDIMQISAHPKPPRIQGVRMPYIFYHTTSNKYPHTLIRFVSRVSECPMLCITRHQTHIHTP